MLPSVVLGLVLGQVASLYAFGEPPVCSPDHFYKQGKCHACSTCPMNTIIKVPCSEFSDLICGPFIEPAVLPEETGNEYFFDHASSELDQDSRQGQEEFQTTMERDDDREYWKTLAFVLIGLLSVLIMVATVVVLVACRRLQKATRVKQMEDGEIDDTDSGYVVIHSIRNVNGGSSAQPPGLYGREELSNHPPLLSPDGGDPNPQPRGRLCFLPRVYKPQRWLLNYDTDEVFESDDSGGSLRRMPQTLTRISENSEKSSDHKSTDSNKENV